MAEDYTKPRYPNDAPVYSPELLESTPVSGSTPFEFYDSDETFCIDAKKAAKFIAYRLGWPLMDVELTPKNMYACFEEAVTTYGNQEYAYKVREKYLSLRTAGLAKEMDLMITAFLHYLAVSGTTLGTLTVTVSEATSGAPSRLIQMVHSM